jgi:hypothetical protein
MTTMPGVVHFKLTYARSACGWDLLNCPRYTTSAKDTTCKGCLKHPHVMQLRAAAEASQQPTTEGDHND